MEMIDLKKLPARPTSILDLYEQVAAFHFREALSATPPPEIRPLAQ